MNNFEFYAPTKVIFGKESEARVGELVQQAGGKNVLIHYGGKSAQTSGLLDRVCTSLKNANIAYTLFGGVVPNPRLSKVKEGVQLCKLEGIDFILAVGGGSVIDSAKAIGYGVFNEGELWDYFEAKKQVTRCLPIAALLTIAAAGSEMSDSSVITNENGWVKRGLSSTYGRCKFAIMNPELTYTLPSYQTASGCTDILLHTMERYFIKEPRLALVDGIAESLMKTVIENAKILMIDPANYEARAEVMWAGSLSHNGVTGTGGDWACHQLEHELSGMFDVAHGAGLGAIWGSWARYVYQEKPERFAQFARNVFNIAEQASVQQTALAGIEAMEQMLQDIEMPISIKELGIELSDEQIECLAYKCSRQKTRTIGKFKQLSLSDMKHIFECAK